jgi:hypothetical protein
MKTPLKMQEKMGNAWVLVSRNEGCSKFGIYDGRRAAPHPRRLLPCESLHHDTSDDAPLRTRGRES